MSIRRKLTKLIFVSRCDLCERQGSGPGCVQLRAYEPSATLGRVVHLCATCARAIGRGAGLIAPSRPT